MKPTQLGLLVPVYHVHNLYSTLNCTSVTCSDLPSLTNGDIDYGGGSTNSRSVDTVATYTCDTGYTLTGGSTRTCVSGGWSGSAPTCQSKWNGLCTVYLLSVSSPIQLTALTYPHWPMGWLCTVLDPLTTDLSSLVLCTPVTLATLSLEVPPGSVRMVGNGLDQFQFVDVSSVVQFVFVSILCIHVYEDVWSKFWMWSNIVMLCITPYTCSDRTYHHLSWPNKSVQWNDRLQYGDC